MNKLMLVLCLMLIGGLAHADDRDPFAILGVTHGTFDEAELKAARNKVMRPHFLGANTGDPVANAKLADINWAYDELTDPSKQHLYKRMAERPEQSAADGMKDRYNSFEDLMRDARFHQDMVRAQRERDRKELESVSDKLEFRGPFTMSGVFEFYYDPTGVPLELKRFVRMSGVEYKSHLREAIQELYDESLMRAVTRVWEMRTGLSSADYPEAKEFGHYFVGKPWVEGVVGVTLAQSNYIASLSGMDRVRAVAVQNKMDLFAAHTVYSMRFLGDWLPNYRLFFETMRSHAYVANLGIVGARTSEEITVLYKDLKGINPGMGVDLSNAKWVKRRLAPGRSLAQKLRDCFSKVESAPVPTSELTLAE